MRLWVFNLTLLLVLLSASPAAFAAPATIDTSTSAQATASSSQRKTFFDSLNNTHWAFYYNGTAIEYSYSADGETWTSAGTLAYNTSSFSAVYKTISGVSYVFVVAEANSFDVVLRRGELAVSSVTFDGEITVFNGTADDDRYSKPTAAISENGHFWVSSIKDAGARIIERFQAAVRRSTNLANGDLSAFDAATLIGWQGRSLQSLVVLPKGGDSMYLIASAEGENIVGYVFDGVDWSSGNDGGDYSWFAFGRPGLWVNSDLASVNINSVAVNGSDVYVGGAFSVVSGDATIGNFVRWDGSNWHSLGEVNSSVYAIKIIGSDVYIGGTFSNAGGVAEADRIARWDGQSWHGVGAGLSGTVYAIEISGSDVYAGGSFADAGGVADADRIARWDGVSWNALGVGLGGNVNSIAIAGTDIYAGGDFTDAGGIAEADRIARWDGASWNALGTGLGATVKSIAVDGTNIFVGGAFIDAGGIAEADRIARWDGGSWNALGTGLGATVNTIAIGGTDLYVAGDFTDAGGVADADRIARWNGTSWSALGVGLSGPAQQIATAGGEVFVVGSSVSVAGVIGAERVAHWDGTQWNGIEYGGINGPVNSILAVGNDLYIAGRFTGAAGVNGADGIARWDGTSWHALGSGLNAEVNAIIALNGDIYAGGSFTDAGGIANADRIARWDGNSWNALGSGIGNNIVYALDASGTDVYVGGSFTDAGGNGSADRIARWNTGSNSWFALSTGVSATVYAIEISGSDVYIGGTFLNAGSAFGDRIVRWTGAAWSALGAGLGGTVTSILADGSNIYVGGGFTNAGGIAEADGIALWTGAAWSALGTGISACYMVLPGSVNVIRIIENEVYIGGCFGSAGGVANTKSLAKWSGGSWNTVVGSGIDHVDRDDAVLALLQWNDRLYIGAYDFFVDNNSIVTNLAYYAPAIAADASSDTEISALSDHDGNIYLSYTNSEGDLRLRTFDDDTSSWQATVTLNGATSLAPVLARKSDNGRLIASWIEGAEVKYAHALSPYEIADWSAASTLYDAGTNASLNAVAEIVSENHTLLWTNGSGSPYSVFADFINMAAPTVTISSVANDPTNTVVPVAIQFNKPVTGFVVGDITVSNGTVGNFVAVDGDTYTVDITPTADGAVTVDVAASVAKDAFDNDNLAATQFSITYDTTAPTVSIDDPGVAVNISNRASFALTGSCSENTRTVAVNAASSGGGAAVSATPTCTAGAWSASLNLSGLGDGTVTVIANHEDAVALAAVQASRAVTKEIVAPTAVLSSTATSPTSVTPIPVAIEFSETVSGFIAADLTVTNATVSGFVAVDGNSYTATLTPSGNATVTVQVAAAKAQDVYGNDNTATAVLSRVYAAAEDEEGDDEGEEPDEDEEEEIVAQAYCSVWNGFFNTDQQAVWNILEHVNSAETELSITTTLYGYDGLEKSSTHFTLGAGQQLDLLVHEMQGWESDSYGLVCSRVRGVETAKDLDGRMVYYRRGLEGNFEYVFASAFNQGFAGEQYVGFNTYQPSLNPADSENFVANWIQVTNLEDELQHGELLFYNQAGELLETKQLTIPARGQSDNSAHDFGPANVGFVRWQPESEEAKFIVKNTRYLYDNAKLENRFDGVFQVQASTGSKGMLSAILDTAGASSILEVANITDKPRSLVVKFYDSEGELLAELNFTLPAYGSQHVVADGILNQGTGSVTVEAPGARRKSVLATVFQYGRTESGGVQYLYGVEALRPVGDVLVSSYNTFLNQGCDLYLSNPSDVEQSVTVSMQRNNGAMIFADNVITLGAKQSIVSNLCAAETQESYGMLRLSATGDDKFSSYLLRKDMNGTYRYPITVR